MIVGWNEGLCRQTETVDNLKDIPKGSRKSVSHVFEIEDWALVYTMSQRMYKRHPRYEKLFYAFLPETAILF